MLNSMTGFGSHDARIPFLGKISVEIRSTNHKFLETVIHAPEGLAFLEEKIKSEIESKIQRGRVTCTINIAANAARELAFNEKLIKRYLAAAEKLKKQYGVTGGLSVETLINLPGVVALTEERIPGQEVWPYLKDVVVRAVCVLAATRRKEGRALTSCLKGRSQDLEKELKAIALRFKEVAAKRAAGIKNEEERAAFLKESDITEELERIMFHVRNFISRLSRKGPAGKELDFIAQEMQREANTMGAKSCDSAISGKVVKIKAEIEKIREQVQNIE